VSIAVASLIHTLAHYFNDYVLAPDIGMPFWKIAVEIPSGMTGHLLFLILVSMIIFSVPKIRKRFYDAFLRSHLLYIPFFLIINLHGVFCTVKEIDVTCGSDSAFWKYNLLPMLFFILDKILRYVRSTQSARIIDVVQHSTTVIEIRFLWMQLKKGAVKPGSSTQDNLSNCKFQTFHMNFTHLAYLLPQKMAICRSMYLALATGQKQFKSCCWNLNNQAPFQNYMLMAHTDLH
jgi:hypothetical protein